MAKDPKAPVTQAQLDRTLVNVGEFIGKTLKPLQERIAELEAKAVSWEGTFQPGKVYAAKSLVQDHGAVWISLRETASRPPSGDWKLAVKSFDEPATRKAARS